MESFLSEIAKRLWRLCPTSFNLSKFIFLFVPYHITSLLLHWCYVDILSTRVCVRIRRRRSPLVQNSAD